MEFDDHIHSAKEDCKKRLARSPVAFGCARCVARDEGLLDLVAKCVRGRKDRVDQITIDGGSTFCQVVGLDEAFVVHSSDIVTETV